MSKGRKYTFINKPEVKDGKVSLAFALVSFALFAAAVIISFIAEGNAWGIVGALGFCGFCFSIYGFYQGLDALRQKDGSHRFCFAGSIASGLMLIVWVAVLILAAK